MFNLMNLFILTVTGRKNNHWSTANFRMGEENKFLNLCQCDCEMLTIFSLTLQKGDKSEIHRSTALTCKTCTYTYISYTGVGLNLRKFSLKQGKPFILKFVLKSNLHLKGKFCYSVLK